MEKMDKNLYPQMPDMPGQTNPESPPSYNQATFPSQPAAPTAPVIQIGPTPSVAPMQPMVIQQGQPTYVQPQAVYMQGPPLGPRPTMVVCPNCHEHKMSNIRYETGTKTHLFAGLLCILGLFCCACIPYCVDNCKNPNHYCSNCDTYLGMYK